MRGHHVYASLILRATGCFCELNKLNNLEPGYRLLLALDALVPCMCTVSAMVLSIGHKAEIWKGSMSAS